MTDTKQLKRVEKTLAIETAVSRHCHDQLLELSQLLSTDLAANHFSPDYPKEIVGQIRDMLNQIRHDMTAKKVGDYHESLLNTLETIANQ